jgi:hypothetical protein
MAHLRSVHSLWFTAAEKAVEAAGETKRDGVIEQCVKNYNAGFKPCIQGQEEEAKFNEAQYVVRQLIFIIDCNLPLNTVRKATWKAMFPQGTWVVRKSSTTCTQLTLCKLS